MKKSLIAFMLGFLLALPMLAFAQVAPLPDTDIAQVLVQLISQWKSLGWLGIGMLFVVASGQAVKAYVGDSFKYKRLLTLALACLYGVLLSLSQGVAILPSLVAVLITGGGAVALYEALKGIGLIGKPIV